MRSLACTWSEEEHAVECRNTGITYRRERKNCITQLKVCKEIQPCELCRGVREGQRAQRA